MSDTVTIQHPSGAVEQTTYRRAVSLVSRGLAAFAKPKTSRPKPTLPETTEEPVVLASAEDMPPAPEE